MVWLAATFHDELDAGTELAIFQEPWDPEAVLPEQLPASVDLGIDFPNGAGVVVWVRDVIGSEAVIQKADQTRWRMVLVDPKQLKYPTPSTEDAPCTYWQVKERILALLWQIIANSKVIGLNEAAFAAVEERSY